jgi:hypothetical protein
MPGIDEVAKVILAARRKHFLFSQPVFKQTTAVSEAGLFYLATRLKFKFIVELSRWLLTAGYGEIDDALVFREDKFSILDWEPLKGFVTFAEDSSGHRFAFDPGGGGIYCIHPAGHSFAHISDDFPSFLQEVIRHDYRINEWVNALPYTGQRRGTAAS